MAEGWRDIRVFISSTFRDMQAERDHLVRYVFPRVREKLLQRRLRLVDVDLRWGVTADQDAFDLCMTEIKLCRPRFIAILGGRYGWVPPPRFIAAEVMQSVLEEKLSADERSAIERLYERGANGARLREKPKMKAEVDQYNSDGAVAVAAFQRVGVKEGATSITAAEVLHGALDELDRSLFRFFYFRDPAATSSVPGPFASTYREPPDSFGEPALATLKDRIAKSEGMVTIAPGRNEVRPLPVFVYPAQWDDRTQRMIRLHEFGDRVERDLLASVDAELGAEVEALDEFAAETAAMEAFVVTRTERYVVGTRKIAMEELTEHAAGDAEPALMVLVGEPGSGKSAMLGHFIGHYQRANPEHLLVSHFVGASAASTNVRQVLRRLWHELVRGAALPGDETIPDEWEKLGEGFPSVLEKAAASKRVVLVIDAVNQLDPAYQAHSFRWLPSALPKNVRVILSVLPGPAFDALERRRPAPRFSPIARLSAADATEIMSGYLKRYGKSLDDAQRSALLSKKDAGNPLYLLTALEELRTLGTYEEITDRIRELPDEVQPLFLWILRRLERDDGFRDENGVLIGGEIVRRYGSCLSVARAGMAEWEIAEISSDKVGNVAALTRLLRPYLMYRGELLDFFHGQIRDAARSAYLSTDDERHQAHCTIAQFFRSKADPAEDKTWSGAQEYPRSVSELLHHLTEAHMWDDVYATLTDLAFLEAKCTYVAVGQEGEGAEKRTVYGGVYELQEDYQRALAVFPEA